MFDRYTDRARRVVVLAQEQTREMKHDAIAPEHILLALAREGEGVGALALKDVGVTYDDLRDVLLETLPEGPEIPEGHLAFTPRAKKVCELAIREALQLGHNYVGTEHLALALARETDADNILGVEPHALRKAVIQRLTGWETSDSTATVAVSKASMVTHHKGDTNMGGRVVVSFRPTDALLLAGMLQALAVGKDLPLVDELVRSLITAEPYKATVYSVSMTA